MVTQLLLGIYFIGKGIVEQYSRNSNLFFSEATIQSISNDNLVIYLRRIGKIHMILGILFVTMGQIEYRYNPEPMFFISTYIILVLVCILMIIYLNKKYLGNYVLRK